MEQFKIYIPDDKKSISIRKPSGETKCFDRFELIEEKGLDGFPVITHSNINPNFEAEVDEFTGETDFIKNRVNF